MTDAAKQAAEALRKVLASTRIDFALREDCAEALAALEAEAAQVTPETIASLQAEIGRLQSKLASKVLGDPRVGVSSSTSDDWDEQSAGGLIR